MKLLTLLFAIAFIPSIDSRFTCPKELQCPCTDIPGMNEYRIHCVTGVREISNLSFDLIIQPEELVRVQCKNFPDWTDFLLGSSINVGSVKRFVFDGCAPPSVGADVNTDFILRQMNVSGVEHLRYVNLEGQLKAADVDAFPNLRYLKLSYNNLGSLDPQLLRGLPNLNHLELDNAHVQIPDGFFDKASSLKILELGGNHIKTLKPGIFDGLRSIELLNLWGNDLSELHSELFRGLISLVSLDIHKNNLYTLPVDIFEDLKNLTVINFNYNNFSSLPKDLFRHNPKLNTVKMINNKGNLTRLPNALLANLTNLKAVTFFRSGLTSLPEDLLWGATALLDLNLDRNLLTTLPAAFFRDSTELVSLKASFNELNHLPDRMFENSKKIVSLDLSKNHLKSITADTLIGLESLRELNMEQNKLEFIDVNAFVSLTQLKIAKFSNNQLTLKTNLFDFFGQVSPFLPCYALEELYLSHNNISEMFGDWIMSDIRLRKLDLSYNLFEYIEMEDLQFSSSPMNIDLRHNQISQINLAHLDFAVTNKDLSSVSNTYSDRDTRVTFEGNPLECNCELYSLLRFVKGDMPYEVRNFIKLDKDKLNCAGPDHMAGRKLVDIKLSEFKCQMRNNNLVPEDPCSSDGVCDCWFRPADKALILDCADKNLTRAPLMIAVEEIEQVELDLSKNHLVEAPNMTANGYEKVRKLSLSYNDIEFIDDTLVTPNLRVLHLDGNNLTTLDSKLLNTILNSTQIEKLSLSNNPWLCDCSSLDFLSFLQSEFRKIPDLLNISCAEGQDSLATLSVDVLCPNLTDFVVIYCTLSTLAVLLFLSAALYYRFQRQIKIWLYSKDACLCLMTEDELDRDKIYDAFISYSHKDEDFVLKELVAPLEDGHKPYRLCVHSRDWLAGEWIPMQIARSVEDSKRTIIVLTPSFINSVWARLEFQAAHEKALKEKRNRVIIVLHGDIGSIDDLDVELKAYLQMNTYIKWGDPWFWQKLKYAMPHTYGLPPQIDKEKNENLTIISKTIAERKLGVVQVNCVEEIRKSQGIFGTVREIRRSLVEKWVSEDKYCEAV